MQTNILAALLKLAANFHLYACYKMYLYFDFHCVDIVDKS